MRIVADKDLVFEWVYRGEHLRVIGPSGTPLFNSLTGFTSGVLSERQVQWITEHYNKKKMTYEF